jgi:hypothetical protein
VLGQSGAPGTSTDHTDTIGDLHHEKKTPRGFATNRACGSGQLAGGL